EGPCASQSSSDSVLRWRRPRADCPMHGTLASRTYDVHHVVESWASNDCASKAQSGEAGNETRRFRGFRHPGQKPHGMAWVGLLDRDAGGNQAIGVDDRKSFSIFTALQIERLERVVVGAIDMNHLARI